MSKNTLLSELINYVSANSSGNVTIAAPSSGYALDVNGAGRFTGGLTLGSTITNGTYTYTLPSATGTLALASDIPSGIISGSLTANYIPRATGVSTLGNSTISNVGNYIGINNAAPDDDFCVKSAGTNDYYVIKYDIAQGTGGDGMMYDYKNFYSYDNKKYTFYREVGVYGDFNIFYHPPGYIGQNGSSTYFMHFDTGYDIATKQTLKFQLNGTYKISAYENGEVALGPDGFYDGGPSTVTYPAKLRGPEAGLYAADVLGGHLYLQGGRSKGTGTPGDVIIQTGQTSSTSGTTLNPAATRMIVKANGNVGIGTTSPASKLHIEGTGTGAWLTINRTDSGTNIVDYTQSGTRLGYIGYIGSELWINNASASDISIRTSGSERMRITSSGNVGIGTTSPTNRLSLFESTGSTTSTLDFLTTGNSIKGHVGMFANNFYITSNWFYNGSQNADSLSYGQAAITFDTSTSNGFLSFATAIAGSTFPSERMRITSGGQVLIGQPVASGSSNGIYFRPGIESGFIVTNDVAIQLGRLGTTGDIQTFYSGSTRVGKIAVQSSSFTFESASNGGITVLSSGYVGVGTTVPTAPFQVAGDMRSQGLRLNISTANQGHRFYSRTMDVSAYTTQTNMRFIIASGNNVQFQYEIVFHATRLSGTLAEIWYLRYTAGIAYDTAGNPNERWWDLREQAGNGIAAVGRSNSNGFFDITNSAFDTSCRLTCMVKITCNNWDAVTVTFP